MEELTGFQRNLLYTIDGLAEPDALTLETELEYYNRTKVYPGLLYPNLDRLVRKGLVERGAKDDHSNCYSLTHRGRQELNILYE